MIKKVIAKVSNASNLNKKSKSKNDIKSYKYNTYKQSDFKWINKNENEILTFPKKAINDIKSRIEIIKKIKKEDRTFANTIIAYEELNIAEGKEISQIHALSMMSDNESIREAARNAEVEFSTLIVDVVYDINLYKSIMDYIDNNYKNEIGLLDNEDLMLVDDIVKGFKQMGFHLPLKERNRIKAIEKTIAKLDNNFEKAVAENKDHILVNLRELAGVPENIINSFEQVKDKKGKTKYKITMQYPVYGPVMKYASNRELRKELYKKFNNRGGIKNVKILEDIIKLRREKSELLGYKDHSSYRLEYRMAKSAEKPYEMIEEILIKLKDKKDEELEMLKARAREDRIVDFKLYDVEYYSNKIREEKYNFNVEEIKEYFELDYTIGKMFEYFGNLFGIELRPSKIKLWHKDALLCEVWDTKNQNIIAYFAVDLFPREGKYSHACMMPLIGGRVVSKKGDAINYETPVAVIICNFSKPQKMKIEIEGKKINKNVSLLTLGEVETLYHEFGHSLHSMLTKAKYSSHAGTNVVWDFVEAPSQLMEEFLNDPKVLKDISSHYVSGKKLSDKQIDRILSLSKYMKAMHYTRQSVMAKLDLDLYTYKASDAVKHYHELMEKHLYKQDDDVMFVSSFSHIVSGYDSGYYSYMWAERICKDFYTEFRNAKSMSDKKKIGMRYRKEILEVGGKREEELSARTFLGREVSNQAFIDDVIG